MKLSYRSLALLVTVLLVSSFNVVAFAGEIGLEEAIAVGLNHNSDILDLQDNLESIERELKQLKAEDNWQLDLTVDGYANELNFDDESSDVEFSITGSRTYWWGLTLESELYGAGNYSTEEELSNDETGLKLSLSQNLYPSIPTEREQSYINKELDLQVAQKQLEEEKEAKIITWLGDYLNLLRLKEKQELAVQQNELALNNFKEVSAKQEINEASEIDILTAQIEVQQAQYSLKEAANNYQQAKKSFYSQLKLNIEDELLLNEDSDYLLMIKDLARATELDLENKSRLLDLGIANSVEIFESCLEQQSKKDDLKWNKDDDKPDIDLTGSYDSNKQWGVGVSLSYNIFDSGKQRLTEETLQAELATLKRKYDDLITDLSLELDQLIDQLKLNENSLKAKELSLAKASLEAKIAKEQLKIGLIDDFELKEKDLSLKEAKINYSGVEDSLLVNKLELIKFLGKVDFRGGNQIEKRD